MVSAATGDTPEDIARDVHAVGQIEALPTMLAMLCVTSGMGFAAVTRVTDTSWTACALNDEIDFGLKVGEQLPLEPNLSVAPGRAVTPIAINQASIDVRCASHYMPRTCKIESFISVPIVLPSGRYFGNLCAFDPVPGKVSAPQMIDVFKQFAALVATALDKQIARESDASLLRDAGAAGELREQFAAILGHELRNPLQAMVVTSELIARKYADPGLGALAGRIKANAKRMSSMIDDALDFARSRLGGGIGIRIEDVADINAGLRAIVKELQDAQPARQIIASINVSCPVQCDLARVRQAASKLLGNALAHGAADRPVKVTASAAANDFVFEVWNDGQPIPAASLGSIFEPFWQKSATGSRQGLGLGLYICAQIVRAHGGRLSATSTAEGGTQFTMRLPVRSWVLGK